MRRKRVRLTTAAAGMNMNMGMGMGMNMGAMGMGMSMAAMGGGMSGAGMGGLVGMGMIPPALAVRGRTMMQNPMAGAWLNPCFILFRVLVIWL